MLSTKNYTSDVAFVFQKAHQKTTTPQITKLHPQSGAFVNKYTIVCIRRKCSQKTEEREKRDVNAKRSIELLQNNSSSPRSISIVQLNTLLCLHLRPIKLVVYKWPYSFKMMGYLILRCVSRLDAFSVYHIRTRLPGYALGRTTDAPEVRPTRSSRTKVSSSQISNAHDR